MDKKCKRIFIRLLFAGIFILSTVQLTAQDARAVTVIEKDISKGNITCDQQGVLYRITGKSEKNHIVVKGGVEGNPIQVDLNGVSINLHNDNDEKSVEASPLTVENGYAVIYIGKDNPSAQNTLYGGNETGLFKKNWGYAGLCVRDHTHVTISGRGKLIAKGGGKEYGAAGIGGNYDNALRDLVIDGDMSIEATGGRSGPGIGSGRDGELYNLTIKSGNIKAQGGSYAPGIGPGDQAGPSSGTGGYGYGITIDGGDIQATGGEGAAGIGGSEGGKMQDIVINDGTIVAKGGKHGAGIGSQRGDCTNLTINGGKITATGGERAAGIGSGYDAKMTNLVINGGTIIAQGGEKAAGIGAGDHEDAGDGGDLSGLKITGGDITATGGRCGAGIGGSDCGAVNGLVIEQSRSQAYNPLNITAFGGEKGAGIGSANHSVNDIRIQLKEGSITATGGEKGAGIGGGNGDTGKIDISGTGTIVAKGGDWGAGIGAGQNSGSGEIKIIGDTSLSGSRGLNIKAKAERGKTMYNTSSAIGSGKAGGGNITIKNAVVEAQADDEAADIGGGKFHTTAGGTVNKISIDNCEITATGKYKRAPGIGGGCGGTIKQIEIRNSEYFGGTIGSSSFSEHLKTTNNIDSITIEGSDIKAYASDGDGPWAGIGSGPWGGVGSITIKKSKVHAKGSGGGAGIGSGGWADPKTIVMYYGGNMGNMLLEDSEIKAEGGKGGAGLGGGFDTSTGDITIRNCNSVIATTNTDTADGAAGIGGGRAASAGRINITGSQVSATGGKHSAGIGCSGDSGTLTMMWQTQVKSIYLEKSTVTATGGDGGAGIGSGRGGRLADYITIQDSEVNAQGGSFAAGIGSGSKGAGTRGGDTHDINVKGKSKITARGGNGAAGIGAGLQGGADDLHFDLTTMADRRYFVKAYGGAGAAGIGSGSPNESGHDLFTQQGYRTNTVTISGGYIYAKGGGDRNKLGSGAGIGGGARKGTLHGFTVTGGYVEASSGAGDAFDIGHGGEGGVKQKFHDDNFQITGGTVNAQRISTDPEVRISGGSVRSRLSKAKDAQGTSVYQTTFMLEKEANTMLQSLTTSKGGYGTKDIFSDGNRKIYLYLPASETNKAEARARVAETTRIYYGTTETDGTGVLKMDGVIGFKGVNPEAVVNDDFVLSLDDDELQGWAFDFRMQENSSAEIREVIQSKSPGAKVRLHGNNFGLFYVEVNSQKKDDDPLYWKKTGVFRWNILREKGSISITENLSKTYDGEQVSDPAVKANGDGRISYTWYAGKKAEGTPLEQRPSNAGTYTVVAKMEQSDHYTAATSEPMTFTIEKRPVIIGLSATENGAAVTVTATVLGAVDANGSIRFEAGEQSREVDVQERDGMYLAEWSNDKTPADEYTVTAEYRQNSPQNYSCQENPVTKKFRKDLAFRTITGETLFEKKYGDPDFTLGAGVESGKETAKDHFTYEMIYEEYPSLEATAAVDGNGQVQIKNAGRAIVMITLSDDETVYNDAVKYVQVNVSRVPLQVKSHAQNKTGTPIAQIQYGTLRSLRYGLTYTGFVKEGDTEETFTKNHGSLQAVPLIPTLGVNDMEYEIGITRVGAPLKIGEKTYQNVFLSRNYKLNLESGKIDVTPAPLLLKAGDVKGKWGSEPEYSCVIEGMTSWDTEETVFESGPVADLNTAETDGKPYEELEPGNYSNAIAVIQYAQKKNTNGKENYEIITAPGDLTIEKAEPQLSVDAIARTYDGKPVEVATTTVDGYDGEEPQLRYYQIDVTDDAANPAALAALSRSARPLPEAPVNAGYYYVEAEVKESNHFNGDSARKFYVIHKANPNPETPNLPDMKMRKGLKLADQALPDGWAWIQSDSALNVGDVRALARYTPKDRKNYRQVYRYLEFAVTKEEPAKKPDPAGPQNPTDPAGPGGKPGSGDGGQPGNGGNQPGDGASGKVTTGDESHTWLWVLIALISGGAGAVAIVFRQKTGNRR